MTELLLYNGFTPLRRSPADVFLDNGIGVLRAALAAADIQFEIEDRATIDAIAEFNRPDVSAPLRSLFEKQIFSDQPLTGQEQNQMRTLYQELRSHHKQLMSEYNAALSKRIAGEQIPVVGIKLWAGSTYDYCVDLCNRIHADNPNTIVVAGGPQVNCFTHEGHILRLSPFDIAVYSEGEDALVKIVAAVRHKPDKQSKLRAIIDANIPNIIYRYSDDIVITPPRCIDVQNKPVPMYHKRKGVVPVHTIVDALGCDYGKCSFCIHPKIYPNFHKRSPVAIVDEMEEMLRQEVGLFSFTASDTPLSHGVQISEEILKRNLRLEYTMLTRAKRNAHKHREKMVSQFRTLIRAGLKSVFFGAESGNDEVLKHVMNKGITANDIVLSVQYLREASRLENKSVNVITSFIYPIPIPPQLIQQGITNSSIMEDNLALLQRMQPDSFHAAPGLIYPGTDWYLNKEKYQIEFNESEFLPRWIAQEFSYHGFLSPPEEFMYSFNGVPLQELIGPSMEFARRGNALGFPSDLWDEHFIFARANQIRGATALQQLSKDLFLDLLVCDDTHTRYLYEGTIAHSQHIASQNSEQ
ncbi:MAG: radical SAM protein [Deltaproteobacteria bacterium]|nr:radical SAM protein [Deltaproteobacteria bacterium]MBN2670609.1 radical SAM protein [Deltaproteobacteria bacterium]